MTKEASTAIRICARKQKREQAQQQTSVYIDEGIIGALLEYKVTTFAHQSDRARAIGNHAEPVPHHFFNSSFFYAQRLPNKRDDGMMVHVFVSTGCVFRY